MIKTVTHSIKSFYLLLLSFVLRWEKVVQFFLTGKHEVQRICESSCDIFEKTYRFEQWLNQTRNRKIRDYWDTNRKFDKTAQKAVTKITSLYISSQDNARETLESDKGNTTAFQRRRSKTNAHSFKTEINHLEEGDDILSRALISITIDLVKIIRNSKKLGQLNIDCESTLRDIVYRIASYRLTLVLAESIAKIKYEPEIDSHTAKVMSLWNNLVLIDCEHDADNRVLPVKYQSKIRHKSDILSGRWSQIGFQGEDPGTDFRGMGLLGLEQLEYLSRKPKHLSINLLRRSLDKSYEYPWAITGINITYNLLSLFRDGSMKHLYYDESEVLFRNKTRKVNLLKIFNDLYVELFLRFDCFWHESKPDNIFAFKELMEKFVDVVKADLCNRNFTFKFIY